MKLICKVCKKEFEGKTVRRKFCSNKCTYKFHNNKNKNKQLKWARDRRGKYEEGKIQCQICSKWYIQICSHVQQAHGLDAKEYKVLIGKDVKKGLIPDWYKKIKSDRNLENKDVVWENLKKGKKFRFKKGVSNNYERSPETMDRLRKLGKTNSGNLTHNKK
jgi:hypothetical protein